MARKTKQHPTSTSKLAGRRLIAVRTTNPRRPRSHGFKSFAIILKKPRLTYAEFIKAGGRNRDLRWDLKHGHVRVA